MFFFKKRALTGGFDFLGADMHNHVLPGIDDGAPDLATSVHLLEELKKLGFSRIIPTPHTYKALYPNTPATIGAAFEALKAGLGEAEQLSDIPLIESYASEYMMDDHFTGIRKDAAPLSFGAERVLIEMSFADSAPMLLDEIFQLQLLGKVPVLAHPERYPYLFGQTAYFEHLTALGCELQLNLLSLTNHYGKGPQLTALKLLEKNLYTWAGTDTHHTGHIDLLHHLTVSKYFARLRQYPFRNKML